MYMPEKCLCAVFMDMYKIKGEKECIQEKSYFAVQIHMRKNFI